MSPTTLSRAARYVGTPYRPHGHDPRGWDCWGCVRYLRLELFGAETPTWGELYSAQDARSIERVAELIAENLHRWRPCEPHAGAVALLTFHGHAAHVGLLLGDGEMIHTLQGCETAIEPISRWQRRNRIRGFYDC